MATNSVTLAVSLPSKADRQVGYSFSAYCSVSSGTPPKASSNILSASLYLNAINVYTSCNLDFGNYGVMPLSTQGGDASYSGSLSGFDASAMRNLAMAGGSMPGTITKSGSYSGNALNFRSTAGSLTIYYEENNASTGSLDKTTVEQSGQITVTIYKSDPSYQHHAIWKNVNGQSITQNVGSGTSSTFTIPANWPTGSATCTIQTVTSSGDFVGNYVLSFSVQLDTSVIVPSTGAFSVSLIQSPYVPSSWNAYVKGLSKAQLSVPNAAAGNNASFQSIDFTCGAQTHSSANDKTWATDEITETGTLACDVSITNNYGNTVNGETQEITVYDYGDPQLTTVMAFRCLENGAASDSGAYISVRADISFASVGGKNNLVVFTVQYKRSTDSNWSTAVTLTSGSTVIIGGNLGDGSYQIRVVAIDQIQNLRGTYIERIESVMTSDYAIHCLDGGFNVSIGMQGNIPMAFQLNPNWKFYHGTKLINLDQNELIVDSVPTSGSKNPVQSGGTADIISANKPVPVLLTIQATDWAGSGPYSYTASGLSVTANTAVTASAADEASAQALKAGILITPSDGEIVLQTSVKPTGTVRLNVILQAASGEANPFFLSNGKGGDTPYEALTEFIMSQYVTDPTENVNMVMLLDNNYVVAILDVKWSTYSNKLVATIPDGFTPNTQQSVICTYYNSSGTPTGTNISVTIDSLGSVMMTSVSSGSWYGISKLFAYYPVFSGVTLTADLIIYTASYSYPLIYGSDLTVIRNQTIKKGNAVKYIFEASFPNGRNFVNGQFLGLQISEDFKPNGSQYGISAKVRLSNGTEQTMSLQILNFSAYGWSFAAYQYLSNVVYISIEYSCTAATYG